jgi:hypothetical protein
LARKHGWDPSRPPAAHLIESSPPYRCQLAEDGSVVLVQQFNSYRGRVYWFCLTLVLVVDGDDIHTERVDTCHDEVHRHRFCRSGVGEDRVSICHFAPGDHMLITTEMDRAYENYLGTWPQRIGEWRAR